MSTLSLLHDLFSDSLVVFLTMLQDFMAPKNKMPKDAESDYTYVTDEEGAEEPGRSAASGEAPRVHAAKAAPMEAAAFSKAAAVATAKAAAEPAPEAATAGPARPADLAEAKRRIPSPSPSSSVPGPERSPRSRGRREDLPAEPRRSRGLDEEMPDEADAPRGRSRCPPRSPLRFGPTGPYEVHGTRGSKGKNKGWYNPKPTQQCPHCWAYVAWTPRGSGLSQHMWSSLDCIAWQIFSQGDYSWQAALDRAYQVKSRREQEAWGDYGEPAEEVAPARSARHRAQVEARHDHEDDRVRRERSEERARREREEDRERHEHEDDCVHRAHDEDRARHEREEERVRHARDKDRVRHEHDEDRARHDDQPEEKEKKKKRRRKRKTHRTGAAPSPSREVDRTRRHRRPSDDESDGHERKRGRDDKGMVWIQVPAEALRSH